MGVRKQRKFLNRMEILVLMDRYRNKQSKYVWESEQRKASSARASRAGDLELAKYELERAAKHQRSWERIESVVLPKLKRALAEMDTPLLIPGDDTSVVLQ